MSISASESTIQIAERFLHAEILGYNFSLPRDFDASIDRGYYMRDHLAAFRARIWHEELGPVCLQVHSCVTYPANWWQHIVQDLMPNWYKKRWPVKYVTVQIPEINASFDAMYPDYQGIHPWGQQVIRFHDYERSKLL